LTFHKFNRIILTYYQRNYGLLIFIFTFLFHFQPLKFSQKSCQKKERDKIDFSFVEDSITFLVYLPKKVNTFLGIIFNMDNIKLPD